MIKLPKNHTVWVRCSADGEIYIITTCGNDRTKYYLFKKQGEDWVKIAQNINPSKLEEKVFKK